MKVLMHHSQRAARSFVRGLEIRLNVAIFKQAASPLQSPTQWRKSPPPPTFTENDEFSEILT
jgi:hypothetical protein